MPRSFGELFEQQESLTRENPSIRRNILLCLQGAGLGGRRRRALGFGFGLHCHRHDGGRADGTGPHQGWAQMYLLLPT